MEHIPEHAFGIIPLYQDYDGYKLLVIQNANGGHWGFPKGHAEAGETPLETALRELQEEVGIEAINIQPGQPLIEHYSFERNGNTYDKTNTFYIGIVSAMTLQKQDAEVSDARWVSVEEMKELFTNKTTEGIAHQVEDYIESLQEHNW